MPRDGPCCSRRAACASREERTGHPAADLTAADHARIAGLDAADPLISKVPMAPSGRAERKSAPATAIGTARARVVSRPVTAPARAKESHAAAHTDAGDSANSQVNGGLSPATCGRSLCGEAGVGPDGPAGSLLAHADPERAARQASVDDDVGGQLVPRAMMQLLCDLTNRGLGVAPSQVAVRGSVCYGLLGRGRARFVWRLAGAPPSVFERRPDIGFLNARW
jgi:hypothetical protein